MYRLLFQFKGKVQITNSLKRTDTEKALKILIFLLTLDKDEQAFPLPFVQDGLKLEMFLNDVELESGVIFVEDAGPYLLSSWFSLTVTFVSASESHLVKWWRLTTGLLI